MSPFLDHHAIKAEIHRRGLTLAGIARAARLEPSACRIALRRRSYAGERAIAEALGVEPSVLWPDRYAAGTSRRQANQNRSRRTSQKVAPVMRRSA